MAQKMGFLVALCLSASLAACAGMMIGTQSWFEQHGAGAQTLRTRASFDLSCPAAQLQFVGLGQGSMSHETVGVTGCERRATYVFSEGHGWVMNTTH